MACIARDNAIKHLIDKGAIDDTRKILDLKLYEDLNKKLTEIAVRKYNLDTLGNELFSINAYDATYSRPVTTGRELTFKVRRAVPNSILFETLDNRIKTYEERSSQPVVVPEETIEVVEDTVEDTVIEPTGEQLEFNFLEDNSVEINLEDLKSQRSRQLGSAIAERLALGMNYNFENITEERAVEILKSRVVGYRGEPAFNFAGTVYVVGDNVTLNTVLHEFGHPLIRSVRQLNDKLYNNLYEELMGTTEGEVIEQAVLAEYPELKDSPVFLKDEVLTYALQLKSANQVNNEIETKGFDNFIKKLLAAIKDLLRGIFGRKIKVSKINVDTTLEELGTIMLSDQIDLQTDMLTEEDIVAYGKDLIERVKVLTDNAKAETINQAITEIFEANKEVLMNAKKTKLDPSTREILKRSFFEKDGRKLLPSIQKDLSRYLRDSLNNKNIDEALEIVLDAENRRLEDLNNKSIALVSTLGTISQSYKNMNRELDLLSKKKNFGTRSDMAILGVYKGSSQRMYELVKDLDELLKKDFEITSDNAFSDLLGQIRNETIRSQESIKKLYERYSKYFFVEASGHINKFLEEELKKDLGSSLSQHISQEEFEDIYDKLIKQKFDDSDVEFLKSKGVPIAYVEPFWKKYQDMVVNLPKIESILSGEFKDVSIINRMVESYSITTNPIVGGLSKYIQDLYSDATNRGYKKSLELRSKLEKLLPAVGYSKSNTRQLIDMLAFKDQVLDFDKEGNPVKFDVYSFLDKFGNGWRYAVDKFTFDIKEAYTKGDVEEIKRLRKEQYQFHRDYMWDNYTEEYYEKDSIFEDAGEVGMEAWLDRKLALDSYNSVINKATDELERFEQYTVEQEAFRKYKQLYSMRDEDGNLKIGREKEKAEILIKYSQATRDFHEMVPIKGSLEGAFKNFLNQLESKGVSQYDAQDQLNPEWQAKVDEWTKQNTKVVYSQQYYERLSQLYDRMNELQKNVEVDSDFDVSAAYKEINDTLRLFKDEQGQPMPEALGEERIARIKELQQQINNYQTSVDKSSGLTAEEQAELAEYILMQKKGEALDEIQKKRYVDLVSTKSKGLSVSEEIELQGIWTELRELSTKLPTEYYLDELNYQLSRFEIAPVKAEDATDYINKDEFKDLVKKDDLLFDWFKDNHVSKKYFGKTVFNRNPAHSISIPSDNNMLLTTELVNPNTQETITIKGIPNARHSRFQVRDKYLSIPQGLTMEQREEYVGKYIDNRGNYLPREYKPGDKFSAKDDRFMNKRYAELNPTSAEYQLLETIKKYHLDVQSGNSNYAKLYLDLPRYAVDGIVESFQAGKYGDRLEQLKQSGIEFLSKTTGAFGKSTEDFTSKEFNYDEKMNLVNTDLRGNQVSYIPVDGLYKLDSKRVDPDLIQNLIKYSVSLETHKTLYENLPFMNAIRETLESDEAKPKNMTAYDKRIQKIKGKLQRPNRSDAHNNMLEQVKSLLDREFYGKVNSAASESMPQITKLASTFQRMSALASLALNIPSDLKNKYGAMVQIAIEASGNEWVNLKNMASGRQWAFQAMTNWSFIPKNGIYAIGPGSVSTQLIELMDPQFKTKDDLGRSVQRSLWKDFVNGEFLYMHRKFGEMEAGLTLFGTFIDAQKVDQVINGKKHSLKFKDIWEQDENGIVKLKEGIDVEWNYEPIYHTLGEGETLQQVADRFGMTKEVLMAKNKLRKDIEAKPGQELTISKAQNFKNLKTKIQGVSRKLFGTYDTFGQPEGNKLLLYRMFFFMRKWFVPMFQNRWGGIITGNRYDYDVGDVGKGFYLEGFRGYYKLISSLGKRYNYLSTKEKVGMKKMASEALVITTFTLLMAMIFGWDDDDEEKWAKIKERSGAIPEDNFNMPGFLTNHALLLMMGTLAETTAYIPLPKVAGINFGLDDQMSILTSTTTAFGNTLGLYGQIFADVLNIATGNEAARYKRDSGPYPWKEEGDLKIVTNILKGIGITGSSGDPQTGIKNLNASGSKLQR